MGSIVSLIIYGVIAAAAVGAVYAGVQSAIGWISAPGIERQRLADEKEWNAAKGREATALSDRDIARGNALSCQVAAAAQTQEVEGWKALAKKNFADAAELKKKAGREATAQAPYIAGLQADAGAKPKLMACQQELSLARDVLANQLRRDRGLPTKPVAPAAPASPPELAK